ncbi:MAG: hypothetical protein AAGI71_05615 [Bacteroidota bacterium]
MLLLATLLDVALALLHVAIIVVGPRAYRYFGAGEAFAQAAEAGRAWPALATAVIAGAFLGFGLYALSGAGVLAPLPLLSWVLFGIAGLFTLRGLALIPQVLGLVPGPRRDMVFSAVSLVIGLVHAAGVWLEGPVC